MTPGCWGNRFVINVKINRCSKKKSMCTMGGVQVGQTAVILALLNFGVMNFVTLIIILFNL